MKLSGEELYEMFRAIQLNHGCEIAHWRRIDEIDAIAWSDLAVELQERSSEESK